MTVSNAGQVNIGGDLIFGSGNSTGTLNVNDAGSSVTVTDDLFTFSGGSAVVTLSGGGSLQVTGGAGFGRGGTSTGSLTIGAGSSFSSDNVSFGISGSTGSLTVAGAGATFSTTEASGIGLRIFGTGTMAVREGGSISNTSTARVDAGATFAVGGDSGDAATSAGTFTATELGLFGSLIFNHTDGAYEFATQTTQTGSVTAEAGTTILTADNTYSGGTTIESGATLQIGNGGTSGSIAGDVTNAGTFAVNRSNDLSFGGVISGAGALTKAGAGTLTLTGANTYTGGTTISGGTLALGASDRLADTGAVTVEAGGTFDLADFDETIGALSGAGSVDLGSGDLTAGDATDTTLSGVIQGAGGSLTKLGAGTLTLTGANTYTGGTAISDGTLQIGSGGTTGSIVGNVTNNATLAFNRSNDSAYSSAISGAGAVTKTGAGTLTWTGNNSFTGGTTISGGTLQIGNGGTSGTIEGDITNNATLAFNRSNAMTFGDVVSGTGAVTKAGAGTLTLTGTNTYTGGTTISAGILQIGSGGTAGVIAGDVTNNATLAFNRSDALTFGGAVSGTGAVTKAGAGTLTLTGTNTYTGGTTISAGTLQIGSGGTAGAIAGDVTNNATLAFNRSDALTFGGVISGTGALTKSGGGTLTLTGNNTFNGGTTVNAGGLVVDGTLGDVTLGAGATLGGSGTVGTLIANGTVGPGNSIGTLASGPATFNAGSSLAVEIDDAGNSDLLDVTGVATINGGDVAVTAAAGTYIDGQQYTIVQTTGGVAGTFDSVAFAGGGIGMFGVSLVYIGNDVLAELSRTGQDFAGSTTDSQLEGTGAGLDELETMGDAEQLAMLQHLYGLTSSEDLDEAMRQLSGSGLSGGGQNASGGSQATLQALGGGLGQTGGGSGFGGGTLTQFAQAQSSAVEWLADDNIFAGIDRSASPGLTNLWVQAIGGFGTRDGSGQAVGQTRSYGGGVAGLRMPLEEDLEAGPMLSYFRGRTKSDDGLATTDSNSVMGAGYMVWTPDDWTLAGTLGASYHDFDSDRFVAFGGFQGRASGTHDGWELASDNSVTYGWKLGDVTVSPTAGMSVSWLYEEAWQETGGGGANLSIDSAQTWSVQPRAGVGLSRDFDVDEEFTLTVGSQALWVGQWGDLTSDYTASFTGGTAGWTVPGLEEPENTVAIGLATELTSSEDWAVSLGYAGRFGDGARDHGILLGAKIAF